MDNIGVINPHSGQVHYVPYADLGAAMEAGGQFADEGQKQKAIQYQQSESKIPATPFNDEDNSPSQPQEEEAPPTTGWKALGNDMIASLAQSLKGGIGFARDIPKNLGKMDKYIEQNPGGSLLHNTGQLISGAAEIGKNALNTPHDVIAELGRKDLIPEWLKKYNELPFTHIPEGTEKALGMQQIPGTGDTLTRNAANVAAVGAGVKSLLNARKLLTSAPSKEKLFQRALEQRVDQAANKVGISTEKLDSLKQSLRRDYSAIHNKKLPEQTPIGQEEAINVKKGKLDKLKAATEIPEEHVGEVPEAPDTQDIIDKKKAALETAQKDAETAIGIKNNPRLQGGTKVKRAIEDVKASASDLYNSARAHYVDKKITADNSADIKQVTKDLDELKGSDELAPGYGSGTASQKALEDQLEALKGEKVNASDIFDLQRTLEKMAEDTRKKQYSGVNDLEFKRLNNLADRLESHAGTLEKRLESVGGKDVQSMIKQANKGWRTYKDLSKRNPVGKAALKGELPTRSMIEIAKDHPGNDFLSNLVESDPELKKHILAAYTGESNVNKLLNPTTLTKKYIQSLPEVEEHVQALKQALQGVKEGEVQASRIKKEYDELVKSMKDAAAKQKERRDAIEESDKLRQQIKFHEDAIPKLKTQINEVETDSSEHKRLQKELVDHKKFIEDKGGRLKQLLTFIAKVKLIGKLPL